jgi:hypothetical protein
MSHTTSEAPKKRRSRVKQTSSLEARLVEQVARLRREALASTSPDGRERLLAKAREMEIAAGLSNWLRDPETHEPG